MSQSEQSPLAPLDPGSAASQFFHAALKTPIQLAHSKSRQPGLKGIFWCALGSALRFILKAGQLFTTLFLSVGIIPVWRVYLEKGPGTASAKAIQTIICAISICWTYCISVRSKDSKAMLAMMLDFGKLLNGDRINRDAPTYRYLVEQYQSGHCTPLSNAILTIRAACRCEEQNTFTIQDYYQKHGKTATDWLCVIHAKQGASLLGPTHFGAWLVYFYGFNRAIQPTDRISRVFSVPTSFPETPSGPSWGDKNYLGDGERFRLLAHLFINRSAGVDTKLHCFDPSKDGNSDFFHEADYILISDPVCENSHSCETLFVAIPGNESKCLRLLGKTIWSEAFRFEFYNRITQAHGSRQCDCIEDATTEKAGKIAHLLGLSPSTLKDRWPEVKNAIESHLFDFPSNDLKRLERRWAEWFSPEEATSPEGDQP
jgi:hypothetical protein